MYHLGSGHHSHLLLPGFHKLLSIQTCCGQLKHSTDFVDWGAYFVLDRKFGKLAAITGAIVVGIFSYQPAFYANFWADSPKLQVNLCYSLAGSWPMKQSNYGGWDFERKNLSRLVSLSFLCAFGNAGMMLIHFRVAAFYILLLLPSVFYLIWNNHKSRSALLWTLLGTIVIRVFTLVLISPGFFDALITRIT